MKVHPYLTPYTKINSKWIKGLSGRNKILRWGQSFTAFIGLGNDFLLTTPKAQATEENTDKLNFMDVFKPCPSKDIIHMEEKQ